MELISEYFVKPKHEVQASKDPIYLNALEICMLGMYPIQKGLLYNYPIDQSPSKTLLNLLDTLKESLSIALVHFYPLAGRFVTETFTDERACSVFIDCNKGPGARLTHVVAPGVTKSDILTPNHLVPSIVKKFFDFGEIYVNHDCHTRPLLSIQVTQLVDGVFIGFTISHCVVDGTSFMHFLSMLSEIFSSLSTTGKSLGISRVPIYDHGPPIKLPYLGLEEVLRKREANPPKDLVFNLSSKSLAKIKAEANNNQEGSISNLSSFQALISLIWRAITRARNISADQETACSIAINARSRVDPPLSDNYFGNYVAQVKVICKVGELLTHDLGWAARRLSDGIKTRDNKSIRDSLELIGNLIATPGFLSMSLAEFLGSNSVVLGGSTRFDMYGLEFGLGRAVAIRMGPGNKYDGKVNVSQGCEGGGSVDLEVSLEENMVALQKDHEFMTFVS
ncbi:putative acetyltransferase At3g50280 [Silene latifolia]|uniref:putative acetyltransferase At3g50280 n=1 Tax=Silene latifolia TaxID=37657 RepID=UPI003D78503E